ncbi:MAG: PIG-L family deacetylase [Candidatus Promineofilum sp.]|nr:PIG-L family deacetylase [Promineifilum sp.]
MSHLHAFYDHLYISPHFDDVALSCGGQVFRHTAVGDTVLVVTVAAEEPSGPLSETAESIHRRWADSLGETPPAFVARRRAEDREAFALLRADVLHLHFLDGIYRPGPDGVLLYPGPVDMFGTVNPADEGFLDALVKAFAALPEAGAYYLPLGVGEHVDHQLARQAGERAFEDVGYYEDYPYTMKPGALEVVLPPVERGNWTAETTWLTETAMAAKFAAIGEYRSQFSSFFIDLADLEAKVRAEGSRVTAEAQQDGATPPDWACGAERTWRKRSAFTLSSFEGSD